MVRLILLFQWFWIFQNHIVRLTLKSANLKKEDVKKMTEKLKKKFLQTKEIEMILLNFLSL